MSTEGCGCRFDAETDEIVTMCAAHMSMMVEAAKDEREACANKAREFAGHYDQGSDGRNTFILLAEWIESRT